MFKSLHLLGGDDPVDQLTTESLVMEGVIPSEGEGGEPSKSKKPVTTTDGFVVTPKPQVVGDGPIIVPVQTGRSSLYRVYIHGSLRLTGHGELITAFDDLIRIIRYARKGTEIEIYINSPGGEVNYAAKLVSAMMESQAHITTIADGVVASAATVIWGYGHSVIIRPHAVFMYHGSSHGDEGHTALIKHNAEIMDRYIQRLFLTPFLEKGYITSEEMDRIRRYEDVYISADMMISRITGGDEYASKDSEPTEEEEDFDAA